MSLDGSVRFSRLLEAEVYQETEEARRSPRGLGEASTISFAAKVRAGDLEVSVVGINDPIIVPRSVLDACIGLLEDG